MKQTAVEWLEFKFSQTTNSELVGNLNIWFEQAKEMEKQQIVDAYHINPLESKWKNIGEQYYNEKFKNI